MVMVIEVEVYQIVYMYKEHTFLFHTKMFSVFYLFFGITVLETVLTYTNVKSESNVILCHYDVKSIA